MKTKNSKFDLRQAQIVLSSSRMGEIRNPKQFLNFLNSQTFLSLFRHSTFDIRHSRQSRGMYLPVILAVSTLFLAYVTALIVFAEMNVKTAELHNKKITATSIAEAGINYYLWHLAHDSKDLCDGNTCSAEAPYGPYAHDYKDQSGQTLGTFNLYISPPELGQSVVTIKSVGKVNGKSPEKTIEAGLGVPYFTKYTLLTNNNHLDITNNQKIAGTVHVNGSTLTNEGEITGDVSSTEVDGINGNGIFGGSKLAPVIPVDMNQVNVDIADLYKSVCTSGEGICLDKSGQKGFHLVLGDGSFTVYKVQSYNATDLNITKENSNGTTFSYPANGVIYSTEDIWLEGVVKNQKVTVVAASSNANKRIIMTNQLKYTYYDGRDSIGIITQSDILLARNAPANMEIDAAMITINGIIGINSYCDPLPTCGNDHKNRIKVYGSMTQNAGLKWTWDQGDGNWSGYQTTETVMDPHNVLDPPPQFPKTGSYSVLSWREE